MNYATLFGYESLKDTVYCKSFEVEKFCSFCGLSGNCETFPVK